MLLFSAPVMGQMILCVMPIPREILKRIEFIMFTDAVILGINRVITGRYTRGRGTKM